MRERGLIISTLGKGTFVAATGEAGLVPGMIETWKLPCLS
jgi:hypothetical protein